MYKFEVNENGYYSGYSKNGTIHMNDEFNLTNKPTECHRHDGTTWVLDTILLARKEFNTICIALDDVTQQLLYNDARYGNLAKYTESYLSKKEELIEKQAELVLILETLTEEINNDSTE